jgi:hypothetical protein
MTALPLSVESQLRARLDFSAAISAGSVSLTTYMGSSSLASAVANGLDRGDLASDAARSRAFRQRQRVAPDPPASASSARMKAVRAGTRWSDSPSAVRARTGREKRKAGPATSGQLLGLA